MKQGTSEGSERFQMNLRDPLDHLRSTLVSEVNCFLKRITGRAFFLGRKVFYVALNNNAFFNKFIPFLLQILKISSKTNEGIDNTWHTLQKFKETMIENNAFQERRSAQQKAWMWQYIQHRLVESFRQNTDLQQKHIAYEALVSEGSLNPGVAADLLLADFWGKERVR